MVMVDEMVQVQEEYVEVAPVLPPVEGDKQGQIVEWGVGMCQKEHGTVYAYALGYLQQFPHVAGPLRRLVSLVQQLKGQNDP